MYKAREPIIEARNSDITPDPKPALRRISIPVSSAAAALSTSRSRNISSAGSYTLLKTLWPACLCSCYGESFSFSFQFFRVLHILVILDILWYILPTNISPSLSFFVVLTLLVIFFLACKKVVEFFFNCTWISNHSWKVLTYTEVIEESNLCCPLVLVINYFSLQLDVWPIWSLFLQWGKLWPQVFVCLSQHHFGKCPFAPTILRCQLLWHAEFLYVPWSVSGLFSSLGLFGLFVCRPTRRHLLQMKVIYTSLDSESWRFNYPVRYF